MESKTNSEKILGFSEDVSVSRKFKVGNDSRDFVGPLLNFHSCCSRVAAGRQSEIRWQSACQIHRDNELKEAGMHSTRAVPAKSAAIIRIILVISFLHFFAKKLQSVTYTFTIDCPTFTVTFVISESLLGKSVLGVLSKKDLHLA